MKEILSISLSRDNEWLAISNKHNIKVVKSPISTETQNRVVPYKYSFIFRSVIHAILNKQEIISMPDFFNFVYCP